MKAVPTKTNEIRRTPQNSAEISAQLNQRREQRSSEQIEKNENRHIVWQDYSLSTVFGFAGGVLLGTIAQITSPVLGGAFGAFSIATAIAIESLGVEIALQAFLKDVCHQPKWKPATVGLVVGALFSYGAIEYYQPDPHVCDEMNIIQMDESTNLIVPPENCNIRIAPNPSYTPNL